MPWCIFVLKTPRRRGFVGPKRLRVLFLLLLFLLSHSTPLLLLFYFIFFFYFSRVYNQQREILFYYTTRGKIDTATDKTTRCNIASNFEVGADSIDQNNRFCFYSDIKTLNVQKTLPNFWKFKDWFNFFVLLWKFVLERAWKNSI